MIRNFLILKSLKVVAKGMVERKEGGSIVNISSVAGYKAVPNHTIYCSAKGAMDQLTRAMALELGPHKVGHRSKINHNHLIFKTERTFSVTV